MGIHICQGSIEVSILFCNNRIFLLLFFGRRFGRQGRACGGISLGFAIGSFALALVVLVRWVAANGDVPHYVEAFTYPWIMLPAPPADPFHPMPAQAITIGCLVDSLTVVMFVVLTLLGALAQLFAMGSVAAECAQAHVEQFGWHAGACAMCAAKRQAWIWSEC